MFNVKEKRAIADAVQKILRATGHVELPPGEIEFLLQVSGASPLSWAAIRNNGAVGNPEVNPHNEEQEKLSKPLTREEVVDDMIAGQAKLEGIGEQLPATITVTTSKETMTYHAPGRERCKLTAEQFWHVLWGNEAFPLAAWNGEDCPMTPSRFREALARLNSLG